MIRSNNNNFSVIPFYNSLDEQQHRKPYAYGNIYDLLVTKKLLPFQFMRPRFSSDMTYTTSLFTATYDMSKSSNFIPFISLPVEAGASTDLAGRVISNQGSSIEFESGTLYTSDGFEHHITADSSAVIYVYAPVVTLLEIYTNEALTAKVTVPLTKISGGKYKASLTSDCYRVVITYYKAAYIDAGIAQKAYFDYGSPDTLFPKKASGDSFNTYSYSTFCTMHASNNSYDNIFVTSSFGNGVLLQKGSKLYIDVPDSLSIQSIRIYATGEGSYATSAIFGAAGFYYEGNNVYRPTSAGMKRAVFTNAEYKIIVHSVEVYYYGPVMPNTVRLWKADGSLVYSNILPELYCYGLSVIPDSTYSADDTLVYPMLSNLFAPAWNLPIGRHYIEMLFNNGDTCVSDIFTIVADPENCISVEWRNAEALEFENGFILYEVSDSREFSNKLLVQSEIGRPSYELEEEGEDRDGYFFPEKQVSKKLYKFSFVAPEYLCDALRLIPMSDFITINFRGKIYSCNSLSVETDWQEQGDLAAVSVEFSTDTVVKKIAKVWQ